MEYKTDRDISYDFLNQSYADIYPNLHKYPATMLPQIGIKLFQDFSIKKGNLLDPYCGSGSSFASGLECGINEMYGFDINPLAILISKAKFTKITSDEINLERKKLRELIFEFKKNENNIDKLSLPKITNINFWFSKEVAYNINIIRHYLYKIKNRDLRNFFLIPFSEIVRGCSYTRNKEFKLYKMKEADVLNFNPDVIGIYFKKLNDIIFIYLNFYFPKLDNLKIEIQYSNFKPKNRYYDTVLTSPPYGDSKTTVAYGQFSTFSNEWNGIEYARKIDAMLMGGKQAKNLYHNGIISDYIFEIEKLNKKRALEVSAFYSDLETSINTVAKSVKKNGKIFYIVGNRTVKNIQLPTDQFIAEKFENNNFKHIATIKRLLSHKRIPSKNSPTNKKGIIAGTILFEYIVVAKKL